ncbi:MAG: DoxX family protein, partial [Actinobacteria bacterium]|nr:DoxX family protein [Actinomycetota bacterium]
TLGTVLLLAGYLKAINLQKSAMAVRAYEILPVSVANILGHILPWFEIAIGALLIIGAAVKISSALGGFTMLMFIIAISQAWARGLSIDCGCFGGGGTVAPDETKYLAEILRDFGLMLMAFFLYRFPKGRFGLDK